MSKSSLIIGTLKNQKENRQHIDKVVMLVNNKIEQLKKKAEKS